ncbi:MAG: diacylglycerol kinase family lipid kinase [Bacteroidetes bacterium]|nr:diacylglycerol kinase family lipid kinase [Bacteroidota bacterium]
MKQHLIFIINPHAGVDREKAIEKALKTYLNLSKYSYEIQHTQHPKHGTELACIAAAKGAKSVVAVGGDGSVNDIAKGLIGTDTSLGIVPMGSGNGLARSLSIPLQLKGAIEVLNKGKSTRIDVGMANEHLFLSNAGVGFDALICQAFTQSKKRGFFSYCRIILHEVFRYKVHEWNLIADGKPLSKYAFMITVANGNQLGYNFKIAPNASWTDGLLDVVLIKKFPILFTAGIAFRAILGNILSSPYVEHLRVKTIQISHPELTLMQTDGDAYNCKEKVAFSILSSNLSVLTP